MAAGSRHEKFLMRQRGAGFQREINEDDFGFDLGGTGGVATSAGTAAQRARESLRSGVSAASRTSRRGTSLRLSAQQETTHVDENGSVVKKRKLSTTQNTLATPAQGHTTGSDAAAGPISSQKSSSGKKRGKRKKISQSSLNKKRSSNATRSPVSVTIEPEVVQRVQPQDEGADAVLDDSAPGNDALEADVPNDAEQASHDETLDTNKAERVDGADLQPPSDIANKPPWKRRLKARKSTGGTARRPLPAKPDIDTAQDTADEPAAGEPEGSVDDQQEALAPELLDGTEGSPDQPSEKPPRPAIKTSGFVKRRAKRKSVNPIRHERQKRRISLETARQDAAPPETGQRSVRPAARKLAIHKSRLAPRSNAPQHDFHGPGAPLSHSNGNRRIESQTRTTVGKQRPRGTDSSRSRQSSSEPKPGSIEITVFRLRDKPRLSTITEESEEEGGSRPTAPQSKGPNAIDALAQVCGEIVRGRVESAKESEEEANGRSEKATAKRQRLAIEAFGQELESRFLEMTQALDHHASVRLQLRQAKKDRKGVRTDLLTSRRDENDSARELYELWKRHALATKITNDDAQIVMLYKKLGRAIRDARNAQQEDGDLQPDGSEYDLRTAENFSSAGGRPSLLGKIKAFNAGLERWQTRHGK